MARRLVVPLSLAVALASGALASAAPSQPRPGTLLVADPSLLDPNFRHSVVLILSAGADGAFGVVINRPTEVQASEGLGEPFSGRDDRVHLGGPVGLERVLFLLRGRSAPDPAQRVLPGVWVTGSMDAVGEAMSEGLPESRLRVVVGSAGWAPRQLEGEIERGDWHLIPARPAWVFSADPDGLWRDLYRLVSLPTA